MGDSSHFMIQVWAAESSSIDGQSESLTENFEYKQYLLIIIHWRPLNHRR